MSEIDIKTKRIIASMIHSRVIVVKAPVYVINAMQQWVEDLDRAEGPELVDPTTGFTDVVAVSDSATLKFNT